MTIRCAPPDPDLEIAIRLASYLDCQSRALGENGFRAFVDGPVTAGLLSGLLTIFVAFIGYRIALGAIPTMRDGVGWMVRIGVVLVLMTSWPAFQALVYRVVTAGPQEVAGALLPASGLSAGRTEQQVQIAYDLMRQPRRPALEQAPVGGAATSATTPPASPQGQVTPRTMGLLDLPLAASLMVVSTVGLGASLKLMAAFLIAVAPIAILALLFRSTLGLFNGWLRGLAGAALAILAIRIVTAIEMVVIGSELVNLQASGSQGADLGPDAQALATIVLLFLVMSAVMTFAAFRMAGAIQLRGHETVPLREPVAADTMEIPVRTVEVPAAPRAGGDGNPGRTRTRSAAMADALSAAARRDQAFASTGAAPGKAANVILAAADQVAGPAWMPVGERGRRPAARRSRSAARRDGVR